jgi:acyl-CoA reductase-like NAD-dependent aldehyde dehydrogenase
MFVAGEWTAGSQQIPVYNPFDNSVIDTVPRAAPADVDRALAFAVCGAKVMARLPGYERYLKLKKAAELLAERAEDLARSITLEEGKILAEARLEVSRAVATLTDSAEEAKRLGSEVVPLDGAPGAGNRFGFTIRVPCGVVAAISPFNFPLNLVVHKVGPALAGGNSVVLKPATDTPLSALRLVEILLEAGVPAEGIQCLTGSGSEIGDLLCGDPRVRKITFTGSRDVGERICRTAGLKKVTMELGSNSPVIVLPDADLEKAAQAIAATGYANAGQVCISAQRIIPLRPVYADLIEALKPKVEAISTGNPLDALANDSRYGLSAAVFTRSLESAMRFAREAESGNIHINWGPQWRADLMPYGGLKESGFGKEGPKYAVQEMTELKMVVMHL